MFYTTSIPVWCIFFSNGESDHYLIDCCVAVNFGIMPLEHNCSEDITVFPVFLTPFPAVVVSGCAHHYKPRWQFDQGIRPWQSHGEMGGLWTVYQLSWLGNWPPKKDTKADVRASTKLMVAYLPYPLKSIGRLIWVALFWWFVVVCLESLRVI